MPAAFSVCAECVTPKRCKSGEVCDGKTAIQERPKRQANRSAKKVPQGRKKQVGQGRRNQTDSPRVQAG